MKTLTCIVLLLLTLPVSAQNYRVPPPRPNVLRGTTEVQIKEFLSHARSKKEWDELAAQVRRRNHGVLPGDVEGDFFLRLRNSWNTTERD